MSEDEISEYECKQQCFEMAMCRMADLIDYLSESPELVGFWDRDLLFKCNKKIYILLFRSWKFKIKSHCLKIHRWMRYQLS